MRISKRSHRGVFRKVNQGQDDNCEEPKGVES